MAATDDDRRSRNVEAVRAFLVALEAMDIDAFMELWADEGVQEMPYAPEDFPGRLDGKAAIRRQYGGLPDAYVSMRFPGLEVHATLDPDLVVAEFRGEIALKAGGSYDNRYCGIFRFREGLIVHYTEYFNPLVLQAAFGGQGMADAATIPDRTMVVKTTTRMAVLADRRDWEGLRRVFADEVDVDYTSLNGGARAIASR